MEVVEIENAFVEGTILWLAQNIKESLCLLTGELAECIRQFERAESIEKLKSEIERVETVVAELKGRATGNKPLAQVFARLKELMYDADDVVGDLDYLRLRLQHQTEGVIFASATELEGTDGDGGEAELIDGSRENHDIPTSKPRKNRSPEWDHFIPIRNGRMIHKAECKYCGDKVICGGKAGTSGMKRHIKNWSCLTRRPTGDQQPNRTSDDVPNSSNDATRDSLGRKRMRVDEAPTQNAASNIHHWDKTNFSGRIHQVALELHNIQRILNGFIKDPVAGSSRYQSTIVSDNEPEGADGDAAEQIDGSNRDNPDIPSTKKRINQSKLWDHFIRIRDRNGKTQGAKCKYCRDVEIKCGGTTGTKGLNTHFKSKKCKSNRPAEDQLPNPASTQILEESRTVDHWSGILNNEEWKSLQLSRGSTTDLKLTYDRLPYHLQQCFFYCSIFPKNYTFLAEDLVLIWISQGFVRCMNSSKIQEEIGRKYFTELVNLGIFKQAERKNPRDQTCYVMPDAMHDFARLISRTECAAIDGTECNGMLPTVHHLSILTDSAYSKDRHGNLIRNLKFEEKLRGVVTSARKLRTLVLIGRYDSFFFQSFQDVFQEAPYLRMLQISSTYADSHSFECKLLTSTHLRYLKFERKRSAEDSLPGFGESSSMDDDDSSQSSESFIDTEIDEDSSSMHDDNISQSSKPLIETELEEDSSPVNDDNNSQSSEHVIDTPRTVVLEGIQPCDNLKHLHISGYSGATSPAWLGTSVTCLQTLHLEDCGEWRILSSLGRLPFLTKLELRNMQSVIEVSVPSVEELVLIKMPKLEICSCNSISDLNSRLMVLKIKRCHVLKVFPLLDSCEKLNIEHKSWLPCLNELTMYKCPHLKVSNPLPPSSKVCKLDIMRVSTLPTMKRSSDGKLIIGKTIDEWDDEDVDVYSNGLTKLDDKILSFHNLRALTRLEIAYCQNLSSISVKGFRQLTSLESLKIRYCKDLFSSDVLPEHGHEDMADTNSIALPSLKHLEILECGITGKWLSVMLRHAPALEELDLYCCHQISGLVVVGKESSLSNHTSTPRASSAGNPDDALMNSGLESLLLRSFTALKELIVDSCESLTELEGNFTCLKKLELLDNPRLESLQLRFCTALEELEIIRCESLTTLEGNFTCLKKLELLDNPGLESLQLRFCTVLEELEIVHCESLTTLEGNFTCLKELVLQDNSGLESLQLRFCTALEELEIGYCASLAVLEGNFTCLRKLKLWRNPRLKSLQPFFCTAQEDVWIQYCKSLDALEDFRSLRSLRYLEVFECPGLTPYLERLSSQGYEPCAGLERIRTHDYSLLTTSICKCLTSLRRLELRGRPGQMTRLTHAQETALQLLTSLQELRFWSCSSLTDLPVGLHSLSSLKKLEITDCRRISRLPEKGLPPSLEELDIGFSCGKELADECRILATSSSKPKVKIGGEYVN